MTHAIDAMTAAPIFAEVRAIASLPGPSLAEATSEQTARLGQRVLADLVPEAGAEWLRPVAPVFERLVEMAKDGGVTDDALVDAIHRAALEAPELFGRLDTDALARALEQAMGPAVLNGALETL